MVERLWSNLHFVGETVKQSTFGTGQGLLQSKHIQHRPHFTSPKVHWWRDCEAFYTTHCKGQISVSQYKHAKHQLNFDLLDKQGKSEGGLIAATGLVIFLKLDSNHQLFSLCDLEIWWMTPETIGYLFYAPLSFLHHFVAIGEFKLKLESGNA